MARAWLLLGVASVVKGEPCLILSDSVASIPSSVVENVESLCPGGVQTHDISEQSVHLFEFGNPIYSNILMVIENGSNFKFSAPDDSNLLPESARFRPLSEEVQTAKLQEIKRPGSPGLGLTELTSFVDAGGNVIVLAQGGTGVSGDLQSLLSHFGMTLFGSSLVKDFFSPSGSPMTAAGGSIKGEPWLELVTGSKSVPYMGSPIGLDLRNNKNVLPILRASGTAFHEATPSQGHALTLGAANQGTNGARFTLVGSVKIGNEVLSNLLSWGFGKRALLRMRDLRHHRVGESEPPRMYKEKDQIEVAVKLEELVDGKWLPFSASDVQLEYVMLDPYIRETMQFTGTEHTLTFTAPDVYGIFKFRINYKRRGYNPVTMEQVAPVRNMRHNDYERFLFCAYPYYASCFVTLGLVLVFALLFVNHRENGKRSVVEKEARHRE